MKVMGKDQTGKSLNHLRHGKLCSSGRKSMGDKTCHSFVFVM